MLGTCQIYLEAHFIGLDNELDDPSAPDKLRHIADGQDTGVVKFRKNLFDPVLLGRTDE